MALATGTVSYLRFSAPPVPDQFETRFCEAFYTHRSQEIDPRTEVEKSEGWVKYDDAFSCDFAPETLVLPSGQLLFRLRIDTLKIPAGTLKAYVDQAAKIRATATGRERLAKKELDQLKLEIKQQLRVKSLPRLQLVEVAWNISTGEVRLFATSKSIAGVFVDKFEKTFEVGLKVVGLLDVLFLRGMAQEDLDSLALLEPERFHLIPR